MAGMPFDATMKDLIAFDPVAWSALGSDRPALRVTVQDGDVSSVSAAADKVLRVEDEAGTWLHDLEPESGHAGEAPDQLFLYSTLLAHRHKLPVCSTLLLLRPEANATAATGELRRFHPGETEPYLIFRYRVVRVWEEPLERFLTGGLGTLPLAVLTNEAKRDIVGVVGRINERLKSSTDAAMAGRMQACTLLLMGLRSPRNKSPTCERGSKWSICVSPVSTNSSMTRAESPHRDGRSCRSVSDSSALRHQESWRNSRASSIRQNSKQSSIAYSTCPRGKIFSRATDGLCSTE